MSFLSILKGMNIEDNCPVDLTFRTSRSCSAFGIICTFFGCSFLWQILGETAYFGELSIVRFSSFLVALGIIFLGIVIMAYQKRVIINKMRSRIDYGESGFFCRKKATYHFSELVHLEVSPIAEGLITSKTYVWTIKAYFNRGGVISGVRLFESISSYEAEEAGLKLSQIFRRPVLKDSKKFLSRAFTSQMGI
ncbi:MAG: hypothetical protein HQM08_08315 [Candidatus Riflebacteria bacterium]|nr:hypothetical protein [Candidatus Riflebacteria bacterium]